MMNSKHSSEPATPIFLTQQPVIREPSTKQLPLSQESVTKIRNVARNAESASTQSKPINTKK